MQQNWAEAINATNIIITIVTVEFVVPNLAQLFLLQELLIKLLQQIKKVDLTIKVMVNLGTKKWDIYKDILAGKKFKTDFTSSSLMNACGSGRAE
eukprot:8106683-Ditylum_brightwellii.AAC.1